MIKHAGATHCISFDKFVIMLIGMKTQLYLDLKNDSTNDMVYHQLQN